VTTTGPNIHIWIFAGCRQKCKSIATKAIPEGQGFRFHLQIAPPASSQPAALHLQRIVRFAPSEDNNSGHVIQLFLHPIAE
jgi:hypothetical protein